MKAFLNTIAGKAGLDENTTGQGIGALLSSLKGNVPDDIFSGVKNLIPDAAGIMEKFNNLPEG